MSLVTRKHIAASLGPFPKRSSRTPARNQRYYTKHRNGANNYLQQTGISRGLENFQTGNRIVRANLIVTLEDYEQAVVN